MDQTMENTAGRATAAENPLPPRKADWPRAWRALRAIIDDPDRTDKVIEFINSTGGTADVHAMARLRAHPDGRRLLAEKPSLLNALSDLSGLAALPAGTLGRTYADFMRGESLSPDGIIMEFRNAETTQAPTSEDQQWFFERFDTMHDLFHVLTGYGRDEAGEAANLAFTFAQFPARGVGFLVLAAVVVGPKDLTLSWPRYLLRAWRRGRRATWLPLARYEELLPRPISEVRRELGIEEPEVAHPGGVVVSQRVLSMG